MTTETILTPALVDSLLDGVLRASGSRLGNYTFQKTLDELRSSIRAIEQAVLQSSEIQALRKDAERYRWLRDSGSDDMGVVTGIYGIDYGSTSVAYTHEDGLCGEQLDKAIDAAMEK